MGRYFIIIVKWNDYIICRLVKIWDIVFLFLYFVIFIKVKVNFYFGIFDWSVLEKLFVFLVYYCFYNFISLVYVVWMVDNIIY